MKVKAGDLKRGDYFRKGPGTYTYLVTDPHCGGRVYAVSHTGANTTVHPDRDVYRCSAKGFALDAAGDKHRHRIDERDPDIRLRITCGSFVLNLRIPREWR